ncbi:MAG: carbohydrate-binding domain-containing protein [Alistipes sp.]|nr:carbohydrate-binding domain-containing protein [Alistipes sp.]
MKKWSLYGMIVLMVGAMGCGDGKESEELPIPPSTDQPGISGGDTDNGSGSAGSVPVTPYDGTKATDASRDVVDAADEDYYENETFKNVVTVHFDASTATVEGTSESIVATVTGANVVIQTTKKAEYILSGATTDGSFTLYDDATDGSKSKLTLNGLELTSTIGPALNIQTHKRVFVHLNEGTTNRVCDAENYTNAQAESEDQKGALFSEEQITFSGTGVLLVSGKHKHALACDDYIRIRPGVTLVISGAVKDGIHTNDGVQIDGGLVHVTASSDGIECEEGAVTIAGGVITVQAADDAITASYEGDDATIIPCVQIADGTVTLTTTDQKGQGIKSTGAVYVTGGTIQITVGGVASKCIKSDGDMILSGGVLKLTTLGSAYYDTDEKDTSSPACLRSEGDMTLSGANITARSSGVGGKGVNCEGALVISSGEITVETTGGQYVYAGNTSSPKGITSEGDLTLSGGKIQVTVSGQSDGSEGVESKSILTMTGGEVVIRAYDDAMNASKGIEISGGRVYCYSSHNDGMDSNGTLTISGGTVISIGLTSPEEAFDCDNNRFAVTGGVMIGLGSNGMLSSPTESACTQGVILYGGVSLAANTLVSLSNQATGLVSFQTPYAVSGGILTLSLPSLAKNTSYTLATGGSVQNATESWQGYSRGGTYAGGSTLGSFTSQASAWITSVNVSTGGQGGGFPGQGPGTRP